MPSNPEPRQSAVHSLVLRRAAAILLPFLVVAGGGTALATATRYRAERPATAAGDSIPVYGPKRFGTPTGGSAYHVERFAIVAGPNAQYSLRVENGAADGAVRLDSARIVLNGATVFAGADIRGASGALARSVSLRSDNTLEVHAYGAAGAYLTLAMVQAPDASYPVFQRLFRRDTGTPVTEVFRFNVSPAAGSPYRVRIANGNPDGTERVSSAQVLVNGTYVVASKDVNQQVGSLERDVQLRAGENVVEVTLEAKPKGHLNFWITATDVSAPVLAIEAPTAGLITREAQVQASGRVQDETATRVTVNGTEAARTGDAFTATVPLVTEGENRLVYSAVDAAGLRTDSVRTVIRDTEAPVITISSPAEGVLARDSVVRVRGTVRDRTAVKANVNGTAVTLGADGAFEAEIAAASEGANFLTVSATDAAGNSSSLARQVIRDTRPPTVTFTVPAEGLITRSGMASVAGTVDDVSAASVVVNGTPMVVEGRAFRGEVPLTREGTITLTAIASDAAGNTGEAARRIVRDTTPPALALLAPAEGAATREGRIAVNGTVLDSTAVTLTLNGATVPVAGAAWAAEAALGAEGNNPLVIIATDAAGNRSELSRGVLRDSEAPAITVTAPAEASVTGQATARVTGTVRDRTPVQLRVSGVAATVDASGAFTAEVPLPAEGANALAVEATDAVGNSSAVVLTVRKDTEAPAITVSAPQDGATTRDERVTVAGTVLDASAVSATLNGAPLALGTGGSFATDAALSDGANSFVIAATDAAGNTSQATRSVTRESAPQIDPNLPPDPVRVASPVNLTAATPMPGTTQFLYSGANPIQTGVAPGVIDPQRVAVLRGRVLNRALQPLPGVVVAIPNHPEFGTTKSRADGWYDLAVNGGGTQTVAFQKDGYLPADRQATLPWQNFVVLPDVVLLQPDAHVTPIVLGASEPQVARSSVTQDEDGPRQATLIVPPAATAVIRLPDGSTQPVSSLTLRATEYTVGNAGPAAMPGALPATSAYTYAVDIRADEAVAAGGTVEFSRPVPLYVENFLDFPVGATVPVGAYDPARNAWVPEDNGRIIGIIAVSGGVASVDANGDRVPDSAAELAKLGIEEPELRALAATYSPGATLWRAPVRRTWAHDLNWGYTILGRDPQGAVQGGCASAKSDPILCEGQAVAQAISVPGTPQVLVYNSSRMPGSSVGRSIEVQLTGATVPAEIKRVEMEVRVAGRVFLDTVAPAPNLRRIFEWDGKDAYGRVVQGTVPVDVRIGHVYPIVYQVPSTDAKSFGLTCYGQGYASTEQCVIPADIRSDTRQEASRNQFISTTLGTVSPVAQGMGGWTLRDQHVYDPIGRVLYTGDGRRHARGSGINVSNAVLGGWSAFGGWCRDGATDLGSPSAITVGADGTVYVSEGSRICALSRNGTVRRIAGVDRYDGIGNSTCNLEGRQARESGICSVDGLTFGPDGLLYFAEDASVRRVDADGTLHTIAGTGQTGFGGDGGAARSARFNNISSIVFGPDGALYIADTGNHRIRRVNLDGTVMTIAGTGDSCFYYSSCRDGSPARASSTPYPYGLAFAPDGTLYFSEDTRVRRIAPDGTIQTVVGNQDGCAYDGSGGCKEGLLATRTSLLYNKPKSIAIDPLGVLYFASVEGHRVWRVGPDGYATRYAGAPQGSGFTNGALATSNEVRCPYALALGPDGSLYTGSHCDHFVVRVAQAGPQFTGSDYQIPSEDGRELYLFDSLGRHLRTVNATTGVTVFAFGYNDAGHLVSVTDQNGKATRLERDGTGKVVAVQGPYGERTELGMGDGGFLTGVTRPGETNGSEFAYDGAGLLKAFTDPRGNTTQYGYDAQGRLTGQTRPDGSSLTLRSALGGTTSTMTGSTGLGRNLGASFSPLTDGGMQYGLSLPGGQNLTRSVAADGTETLTAPDGTITTVQERPDPRFGMQAPLRTEMVRTPSGLTRSIVSGNDVVLANPNDPLSVQTVTNTTSINGRVGTEVFDKATLRVTRNTAGGRRSVARLDSLARVVEQTMPGFEATTTKYDSEGRVEEVRQGTRMQRYGYDTHGRVSSATDALNRTTRYAYDAAGRIEVQTLPDLREIRYRYDAAGNLESVTPPSRPQHRFGFTAANQPETYTPPELATGPTVTRNLYNTDGQLRQIVRPGGTAVEMRYDSAGRRSAVLLPEGALSYQYDAATGQLVRATRTNGAAVAYGYDGALLRRTTWSGALSGEVRYRYDSDFRVAAQVVGTDSVSFRYDSDGLLTGAGALTLTRDPQNGLLTGTTLGSLTTSQGYTGYGERKGITAAFGGAPLFQTLYTRDDAGRIRTLTETLGGQTRTFEYGYDGAGRLHEVKQDGAVAAVYEYDDNGNRKRVTTTAGVVEAGTDTQDRLVSYGDATYGYTLAGELEYRAVGSDTTRYRYDALGNLLEVALPGGSRVEYVIDAENRRIGRKVDGRVVQGFLWEGALRPVAELDSAGAVVARFVYGERPNVPEYMTKGGRTYRLVLDHLGSVRLVVDAATGEVAQRIDYDAYGQVLQDSRPGFQPFGYAGGLYDERTGLVRFGGRDYDPRNGRWTGKDRILFDGGDANLYGYTLNDPVNGVDPAGTFTMAEAAASFSIGASLGGLNALVSGNTSVKGVLIGATVGGVFGLAGGAMSATATVTLTGAKFVAANAVAGAMFNGLDNYFGQVLSLRYDNKPGELYDSTKTTRCVDWGQVAVASVAGGLGGYAGAKLSGDAAVDFALRGTILGAILENYVEMMVSAVQGAGECQ